jgi:hypothetical protein
MVRALTEFITCSSVTRALTSDNEHDIARPPDQVDFAQSGPISATYNAVAFQQKGEGSKAFGGIAATVSLVRLARFAHFMARSR